MKRNYLSNVSLAYSQIWLVRPMVGFSYNLIHYDFLSVKIYTDCLAYKELYRHWYGSLALIVNDSNFFKWDSNTLFSTELIQDSMTYSKMKPFLNFQATIFKYRRNLHKRRFLLLFVKVFQLQTRIEDVKSKRVLNAEVIEAATIKYSYTTHKLLFIILYSIVVRYEFIQGIRKRCHRHRKYFDSSSGRLGLKFPSWDVNWTTLPSSYGSWGQRKYNLPLSLCPRETLGTLLPSLGIPSLCPIDVSLFLFSVSPS